MVTLKKYGGDIGPAAAVQDPVSIGDSDFSFASGEDVIGKYIAVKYQGDVVGRFYENAQLGIGANGPRFDSIDGSVRILRHDIPGALAAIIGSHTYSFYTALAQQFEAYTTTTPIKMRFEGTGQWLGVYNDTDTLVAKIDADTGLIQYCTDTEYGGGPISDCEALQVDDAIETDIVAIPILEEEDYIVEIICRAVKTDGTLRAQWKLSGCFYRPLAGTVTQFGNITHMIDETSNPGSWNCRLVADTGNNTIDIRVTGQASVRFKVDYKIIKVTI